MTSTGQFNNRTMELLFKGLPFVLLNPNRGALRSGAASCRSDSCSYRPAHLAAILTTRVLGSRRMRSGTA